MEPKPKLFALDNYPIDSIPLDEQGPARVDESAKRFLYIDGVHEVLLEGYGHYYLKLGHSKQAPSANAYWVWFDFLVFTGYSDFIPNKRVKRILSNRPDIAVTDLDKALVGCIYNFDRCVKLQAKNETFDYSVLLESFVAFIRNAQNYELRTHKTVNLRNNIDKDFIIKILSEPSFSEIKPDMLDLSDEDAEKLDSLIQYRDRLVKEVLRQRVVEREYASDEENKRNWKYLIFYMNYCASNEEMLIDLYWRNDIPPVKKIVSYERFFIEAYERNHHLVLDSGITFGDLLEKFYERIQKAGNYLWVTDATKRKILMNSSLIDQMAVPENFNCILISYHAFMLGITPRNVASLSYKLYRFLKRNLDENSDLVDIQPGIENCLLGASQLVFDYYEKNKEIINSISFPRILEDKSYESGKFFDDIERGVSINISSIAQDQCAVFNNLDQESKNQVLDKLKDAVNYSSAEDWYGDYMEVFRRTMPAEPIDEKKLWNIELGKRLVVSINAIYIMTVMIGKLLSRGMIEEPEKFRDINQRLIKLDKFLIMKTYNPLDIDCMDSVDMQAYREIKGIAVSETEMLRRRITRSELQSMSLLRFACNKIREIRENLDDMDHEKAIKLKREMLSELQGFPDGEPKEYLIDLIDETNRLICDALIKKESQKADFESYKEKISQWLGPGVNKLPTESIIALTSAEMLYAEFSTRQNKESDFDFSGVASAFYQAVESMFNKLLWGKYAKTLNNMSINKKRYPLQYRDINFNEKVPKELQGYLPLKDKRFYLEKHGKGKNIVSFLMVGSIMNLMRLITVDQSQEVCHFREFVDREFGHGKESKTSEEYLSYSKKLEALYRKFETGSPKRNNDSHGYMLIDYASCEEDRRIVLGTLSANNPESMGIVQLFISIINK